MEDRPAAAEDVTEKDSSVNDPFLEMALVQLQKRLSRGEIPIPSDEATPDELARLVLDEGLPGVAKEFADDMIRRRRATVRRDRKWEKGFRRRLQNTWGEGLDRLWLLLGLVREAGEQVNREDRSAAIASQDFVWDVLVRLHGRACRTGYEILTLLDAGLASAAHARWRSLHEVAAVAFFVKEHGPETAERYLLHGRATAFRAAVENNTFAPRLGYDPIPETEIEALRSQRDGLRARFGPCFDQDNGWALVALGISCAPDHARRPACRASFAQIERAARLDHWRPFYRMASHPTHPTARSLEWTLGAPENQMLVGASDGGLADPGQDLAVSLCQVAVALLTLRPTIGRLTVLQGLRNIADDAMDELMKSNDLVERRASAEDRLWRWQDALLRRRPR
jgi:hypothetical protein